MKNKCCVIGCKNSDGSVSTIVCSADGAISGVGTILCKWYNTAEKVNQLILGENHVNDMARRRKTPRLNFVLLLQFFDKFFRNVLDNFSQHHHIMLLRPHASTLWLVAEKKMA